MSTLRESSHVSRKYVSHGGAISGQGHSANSSNSLENNLGKEFSCTCTIHHQASNIQLST